MKIKPHRVRDEIHVYKNGIEVDDYVLIVAEPGGSRAFGSGGTNNVHTVLALRELADAMEADAVGCGCDDH